MIEEKLVESLINEMRNKYRKLDKELNSPFCNLPNRDIEINKNIAVDLLGILSCLADQVPKLDSRIDTIGIIRELNNIFYQLEKQESAKVAKAKLH